MRARTTATVAALALVVALPGALGAQGATAQGGVTILPPAASSGPLSSEEEPALAPAPEPAQEPAPAPAPEPAPAPAPEPAPAPAPASQPVPAAVSAVNVTALRDYPLHTGIIATTFWVGEIFDPTLPDGSQVCSTYDSNWAANWSGVARAAVSDGAEGCAGSPTGGCDGQAMFAGNNIISCETEPRTAANDFFPSGPAPQENPFYLDLPFDDYNDPIAFAERCAVVPWANDPGFAGNCDNSGFSYLKNRWVEIAGPNGATCYGQIQDAGPSHGDSYHDSAYVFGSSDARPSQGQFNNAGMDVSPALNGCLGFASLNGAGDQVSWRFVDDANVPDGPWKRVVTSSGVN